MANKVVFHMTAREAKSVRNGLEKLLNLEACGNRIITPKESQILNRIVNEKPIKPMQVFAITVDDVNCGCCNWEVGTLYVRAYSAQEAEKLYDSGEAGICGSCFADMLADDSEIVLRS